MSVFTHSDLIEIREHPHLLGHLAGFTKLTEMHSQWILYIWDCEIERCLQAHRDSYKTTAIDVTGAIWWLLFHGDDRIGIIRKNYTDAANTLNVIRNSMKKQIIRELFKTAYGSYPEFKIQRAEKLEFTFKRTNTQEGSVNAYGLSGLTGKHLDKIICDDFVDLNDRISPAKREHTILCIQEIRTNVIESGKCVSFIGTPWHKNDAWSILPIPLQYDVYSTKLLTNLQIEDKRKKTTPSLFAANYLLKHESDEGKLFQNPVYKKWAISSAKKGCYGHLDAAFDGIDTNALTFMSKIAERPGKVQAVGFHYPGHVNDWLDFIEAEYRKRKCTELLVETNADKGATAEKLKKRGLNIFEYHEDQNKHIKITTYLYDGWTSLEWDFDTDPLYMEQIIDYQKGSEPDDAPDDASTLWKHRFFEGVKKDNYGSLYED